MMQGARKVDFVRQQGADSVVDLDAVSTSAPLHQHIKQHAPKGAQRGVVIGGKALAFLPAHTWPPCFARDCARRGQRGD